MHLLTARKLRTGYPRRRDDAVVVSTIAELAIAPRTLISLLGPNGGGKSTLLRTLAGLQHPLAGTVHLGDKPIEALSAIERAQLIAYLGPEPPPALPIRVYEYVALGRHPHTGWVGHLSADDHRIVDRAIADADLGALIDRDVGCLSDGERQRVHLARGIAQTPRVLLLDEPTAHLDIAQRSTLAATLRRVIERDALAVVASTHDLDFARQVADRLWLLRADGSLAADTAIETFNPRLIDDVFDLHAPVLARDG